MCLCITQPGCGDKTGVRIFACAAWGLILRHNKWSQFLFRTAPYGTPQELSRTIRSRHVHVHNRESLPFSHSHPPNTPVEPPSTIPGHPDPQPPPTHAGPRRSTPLQSGVELCPYSWKLTKNDWVAACWRAAPRRAAAWRLRRARRDHRRCRFRCRQEEGLPSSRGRTEAATSAL